MGQFALYYCLLSVCLPIHPSLHDGANPNEEKFSHWLALFARYGTSATIKNIAKGYRVMPTGNDQSVRLAIFKNMESEVSNRRKL